MAKIGTEPSAQEKRLNAYVEELAQAIGHIDRHEPLRNYCKGLLLPLPRKSVEAMATLILPKRSQHMRQSMHHLVSTASWSDEDVMARVRGQVLPLLRKKGPIVAWAVDDSGIFRSGPHSVGNAVQTFGTITRAEMYQVAITLSAATWSSTMPLAHDVYMPEEWINDSERRTVAGVPNEIVYRSRVEMSLRQMKAALDHKVDPGVVLAGINFGGHAEFRAGLDRLGLQYLVNVGADVKVWAPGTAPEKSQRDVGQKPVTLKQVSESLDQRTFKILTWKHPSTGWKFESRFAAARVRPVHRDDARTNLQDEMWMLIEWPAREAEPVRYWLSTMPADTGLAGLVKMAKHRIITERDFDELRQQIGLAHFEGRNWRGFYHHATICMAAYGFLLMERLGRSPTAKAGEMELSYTPRSKNFKTRAILAKMAKA